jgi:hypothetical protein
MKKYRLDAEPSGLWILTRYLQQFKKISGGNKLSL